MRKVRYRWDRVKVGQTLFVPCLEFEATRREGLAAALAYRYKVTAQVGIKDGVFGVLFVRVR